MDSLVLLIVHPAEKVIGKPAASVAVIPGGTPWSNTVCENWPADLEKTLFKHT